MKTIYNPTSKEVKVTENHIEYASNNSTTTTNDETHFYNGMDGSPVRAFAPTGTNSVYKDVQFNNPIRPDDDLSLEFYIDGVWRDYSQLSMNRKSDSMTSPTVFAGCDTWTITNNIRRLRVNFYSKASETVTWASLASSGYRWRVKKISGSNFAESVEVNKSITVADNYSISQGISTVNVNASTATIDLSSVLLNSKVLIRKISAYDGNAITINASGATFEGLASISLYRQYSYVELERISATVFAIKDEKSLASFIAPVDCTSRVAEYTGDGIPLIPDNVAGRTYFQDEWATTDGWSGINCTITATGGKLVTSSPTNINQYITRTFASTSSGKLIRIRIRKINGVATTAAFSGDMFTSIVEVSFNNKQEAIFDVVTTQTGTTLIVYPGYTGRSESDTYEIDFIYIGTGAYDTPALDRAGNGNNLTLNAVTPVNGKYGKEMSFNGSTSYARASSPVIGTTGTIAVRFKRGAVPSGALLSNANTSLINGLALYFSIDTLVARFRNGTSAQDFLTMTITETVNYHTAILTFSLTEAKMYVDNNTYTLALTSPMSIGTKNLVIGATSDIAEYFNGIISHFRYDSRIWTADEARAWSLNPISIDSRV